MRTGEAKSIALMSDFAERTGLTSDAEARRYLWTDAFALWNWLELERETGDERYRGLAVKLIDQVHRTLGRHRQDDPRTGWLSGLPEAEGALHPTLGGLRIGKPLPERRRDEPFDERLEWERDGQYFHYLTKWMDALARAATLIDEPRYHVHAAELAEGVFPHFLQRLPSGQPVGLAWKMSIDLSRPLVSGISPHDALDGYVTFRSLSEVPALGATAELDEEIAILRQLSAGREWATSDPLGIGGLLLDAFRLTILPELRPTDEQFVDAILAGADVGLRQFLRGGSLQMPASGRLAFRELGLAIGLQTLPAIAAAADRSSTLAGAIDPFMESLSGPAIEERIVAFWSEPKIRNDPTWQEHRDINEVMLATAMLRAQVGTAQLRGSGGLR